MKKATGLILAISFGFIIGSGSTWFYCGHLLKKYLLDSCYERIVDETTTLTWLRQKANQDLVENKENSLSIDVFSVSTMESLNSLSEKQLNYLTMAVHYRQKYPFQTGNRDVDEQVERFLVMVQERASNSKK